MVNKAKKQGTTYETNIVNRLNKEVDFKAQRFAEGGSKDLGDIQSVSYTHLTLPTILRV